MPLRYERDDARRRVVVTITGEFQADDVLAVIARQHSEDTWTYGIFYDLRGMAGHPTIADLRHILDHALANRDDAPRGPVALLATDPILYGRLCTYAALGRSRLTLEVFRDWDEAERWLTTTLNKDDRG
jgi:hypothetical protein